MTTAFQHSYLRRILLVIAALWGQSGVCALLDRLDRAFPRWLAGRAVFRLFARDGAATRAWPGSITSAVMGGAANLPTALVRWIYRPCRKVLEGSFFWRLIALLGQSTALLTGLFLLVLLSVPHDYWNNAYGFLGALVLAGLFVLASARGQLQVELKRLGPWFALFLLSIGKIMSGDLTMMMSITNLSPMLLDTTDIIDTYVYRSVIGVGDFVMGSAVGLYQSIFGFILVLFSNWLVGRFDKDYQLF